MALIIKLQDLIYSIYKSGKKLNFLILLLLINCATTGSVRYDAVRDEIITVRKVIVRNRNNMGTLKNRKIGKSGFFYIIDRDGIVIYHPSPVLIGKNFSKYGYIRKIMENESGCHFYNFGNMKHMIIFIPINDREKLCLSIPAEEVSGSGRACISYSKVDKK